VNFLALIFLDILTQNILWDSRDCLS